MICPYNLMLRKTIVERYTDEDGEEETVEITAFARDKCAQEDCGAWYDGRCNYQCASD